MDKQLLSLYKDFELEELESLSEYPEEIETGEKFQTDFVVAEHLKVINYLIEKK
jgi:hypothetical protein